MILSNKVDILCIQETKKEVIDRKLCQYLWGDSSVTWEYVPSTNAAGGLLCIWNNESFSVDRRAVGRGFIMLEGVWVKENKKVFIINVYAPCDLQGKRDQWFELLQLKSSYQDGLWCVLGDFNSIRHQQERLSSSQTVTNSSNMAEFNSWISDMNLEEVRSIGRKFTWYRPNGCAMSKLDRFLLSNNWLSLWPDTTQFVLERDYSDHCPILLRSKTIDWGPKPFRIMDWWLKDKDFQNLVALKWGNYHPHGWGGYALKTKLKFLKDCIRQWSLSHGDINAKKVQSLKKELNALEAGCNYRILSTAEVNLKKSLQEQLWCASNALESMLKQKARVKWLKEGDKNSAYFHKLVNYRRRHNAIQGLIIDGEWVHDPGRVKNAVLSHFKNRFSEQFSNRPTLEGVQFPSLDQGQKQDLAILRCFEMVSGLKINYAKSQFGCWGKSEVWCSQTAHFLNCNQLVFPFSYLGIPVGSNSKSWGVNSTAFSNWWKDLKSIFQQQHSNSLTSNLGWKLGNGAKIRFWKDKWREDDLTLQEKYPALYQVSYQQDSSINLMGNLVDNKWEWRMHWRRNFFDHEIDLVAAFMDEIDDVQIYSSSLDSLIWKADPSGAYSTKSAYNLFKNGGRTDNEDRTFEIIWNLKIPPRASAFSWRLLRNRLPTKANLRKRQITLLSYRCPLCDHEEEDIGHIMFSCRITRSLWWEALRWVNRVGPFSIDPKNHFMQFSHWNCKSSIDSRWEVLWIALSMTIWKHRNLLVFKNQIFNPEKVMDEALFHTWSWLKGIDKDFLIHCNQWSSSLQEELS
ncbi:hypothetical protein GmHk_06G016557 [Glycine max]|nr:hypothetical protein GmHk_06G016557 [Glycine max]